MTPSKSQLLTSATVALLASQGALGQQLTKPILNPEYDLGAMSQAFLPHLIAPAATSINKWPWGKLPAFCKSESIHEGFSAYDMEVYEVTFADCSQPWYMCRHNGSTMSVGGMINAFGSLPVGTRDFIRHIVVFPGFMTPGVAAHAKSGSGDLMFGQNYLDTSLWIHESGHIFDRQHGGNGDYSATSAWLNAYNSDSHLPTGYANTNQAENFAEHVILATYDNVVPGGLAGIPAPTPNHLAVQNQYTNVKNLLGNKIRKVTGATCNRQPTPLIGITSPVVCMGPDALAQGACVGTPNMKRDENGHDALIAAAEKEPGIYEPASRWTESA
ncbi:uncharacterized protein PODANS_1_18418 [Podospora anserina S mat+]|uniref:Podospora anserina S mat+ genomic DNA chromosome 1, supercontig 4 n=1 Tax=Podospora anserina (strain S / ATCC MYA-4624 / DSM 980 / FGSC 10383) TaxID=515849 RepID=B2AU97_PODAN|nr:uncharacterized protein PODANS_1_18418 [Podospora anserina S mat+]CAP67970.1 unnamed protein product [Podospora anserina S mat+]CDP24229.1 Putative protein similar to conidiation-specific protein 13 of Neurospora crassa [Podospora anserina S mat+]